MLGELQGLADAGDDLRRTRGRRGLEVLEALRREPDVDVEVLEDEVPGVAEVDAKLVRLCLDRTAALLTLDTNLAKAAALAGVRVLNLHALALALRPPVTAGEEVAVLLIKPGKEPGQAVGYLDDGTMVVVERARESVGKELTVVVTSVLTTANGRMVFAHPVEVADVTARSGDAPSRSRRSCRRPVAASGSARARRRRCGCSAACRCSCTPCAAWRRPAWSTSWSSRRRPTRSAAVRALLADHHTGADAAGRAGRRHPAGVGAGGAGALPDDVGVVLVHDAARPLAPVELVDAVAAAVRAGADAVVPGLPVTDTVKRGRRRRGRRDRRPQRACAPVQTPQGFRRAVLEEAHLDRPDGGSHRRRRAGRTRGIPRRRRARRRGGVQGDPPARSACSPRPCWPATQRR